jgi:hypothetical protein
MLRPQQQGTSGHQHETLADADGTSHNVAWWFTQPTRDFMAALASPANTVCQPGNAAASTFVTRYMDPANSMGAAFDQLSPDGKTTCRDIAIAWINAGCPLPPATPGAVPKLRMNSPPIAWAAHPTMRLLGLGTVH